MTGFEQTKNILRVAGVLLLLMMVPIHVRPQWRTPHRPAPLDAHPGARAEPQSAPGE